MVDLVLALYPAFFFWNVNLKIMHKLGLSILMGLGVVYVLKLLRGSSIGFNNC